jgi:hypothetical protein
VAKGNHRRDDRGGVSRMPKLLDETAIDLDFVDIKPPQIAQA